MTRLEHMLAHARGLEPDGPPAPASHQRLIDRAMATVRAEAAHIERVCAENRAIADAKAEAEAELERRRHHAKRLFTGNAFTELNPLSPRRPRSAIGRLWAALTAQPQE